MHCMCSDPFLRRSLFHVDVEPKIGGGFYPQNLDGENNGENPFKMDDLGVPLFL